MSKEGDIVIAKMDATANDVPKPYEVRGLVSWAWIGKQIFFFFFFL